VFQRLQDGGNTAGLFVQFGQVAQLFFVQNMGLHCRRILFGPLQPAAHRFRFHRQVEIDGNAVGTVELDGFERAAGEQFSGLEVGFCVRLDQKAAVAANERHPGGAFGFFAHQGF